MPKTRNGTGTGFYDNDDVLIFKKDDRLDKGEEHQIWYGQDFQNTFESNNDGEHCVNVDVLCLI